MQADQRWTWREPGGLALEVGWCRQGDPGVSAPADTPAVVLIHGFGANTNHWRHTAPALSPHTPTYALDLIGFGTSSQPRALLAGERGDGLRYGFDLWGEQVASFCREVVQQPVLLVGNSIGAVVALRAAQLLTEQDGPSACQRLVLIDCAQRLMDDKQLATQPAWMAWIRPLLKTLVSQRWLSTALFRNAARPSVIRSVLKQAYPSGSNVDDDLVALLHAPTQRPGSAEAFRGFINLFDDYLAPDLMQTLSTPIDLIWGSNDPWEPVMEAKRWANTIAAIHSLTLIQGAGHCPHDESPDQVNAALLRAFTTCRAATALGQQAT